MRTYSRYPNVVHGLCKSGNHSVCKLFEDWNAKANFCCACTECDHPQLSEDDVVAHEIRTFGHVRWETEETDDDGLDQTDAEDVASWFVSKDDASDHDGHPEAHEENTTMSETETIAPPVVTEEPVHEDTHEDTTEATEAEDTSTSEAPSRSRGELENEVKDITDLFVNEKLKLPEDKHLTPHYIALAIQKKFEYDEAPSTGAVAAVLKRWEDYNYATFGEKPFHFTGLTDEGKSRGLAELREETKARRKEQRRKEREAAKAAASENEDASSDSE